jgi:hypothetical protein
VLEAVEKAKADKAAKRQEVVEKSDAKTAAALDWMDEQKNESSSFRDSDEEEEERAELQDEEFDVEAGA